MTNLAEHTGSIVCSPQAVGLTVPKFLLTSNSDHVKKYWETSGGSAQVGDKLYPIRGCIALGWSNMGPNAGCVELGTCKNKSEKHCVLVYETCVRHY